MSIYLQTLPSDINKLLYHYVKPRINKVTLSIQTNQHIYNNINETFIIVILDIQITREECETHVIKFYDQDVTKLKKYYEKFIENVTSGNDGPIFPNPFDDTRHYKWLYDKNCIVIKADIRNCRRFSLDLSKDIKNKLIQTYRFILDYHGDTKDYVTYVKL